MTREQALVNGFQFDVSSVANRAGIPYPVFITSAAYSNCVKTPGSSRENVDIRLWNAVNLARLALDNTMEASVEFEINIGLNGKLDSKSLSAKWGPFDTNNPRPTITILTPEEFASLPRIHYLSVLNAPFVRANRTGFAETQIGSNISDRAHKFGIRFPVFLSERVTDLISEYENINSDMTDGVTEVLWALIQVLRNTQYGEPFVKLRMYVDGGKRIETLIAKCDFWPLGMGKRPPSITIMSEDEASKRE